MGINSNNKPVLPFLIQPHIIDQKNIRENRFADSHVGADLQLGPVSQPAGTGIKDCRKIRYLC
jgi:hypothetical protein